MTGFKQFVICSLKRHLKSTPPFSLHHPPGSSFSCPSALHVNRLHLTWDFVALLNSYLNCSSKVIHLYSCMWLHLVTGPAPKLSQCSHLGQPPAMNIKSCGCSCAAFKYCFFCQQSIRAPGADIQITHAEESQMPCGSYAALSIFEEAPMNLDTCQHHRRCSSSINLSSCLLYVSSFLVARRPCSPTFPPFLAALSLLF